MPKRAKEYEPAASRETDELESACGLPPAVPASPASAGTPWPLVALVLAAIGCVGGGLFFGLARVDGLRAQLEQQYAERNSQHESQIKSLESQIAAK